MYLIKSVIHDWVDERAVVILENCRQAIGPDGKRGSAPRTTD